MEAPATQRISVAGEVALLRSWRLRWAPAPPLVEIVIEWRRAAQATACRHVPGNRSSLSGSSRQSA
jgi:hypothetical protein